MPKLSLCSCTRRGFPECSHLLGLAFRDKPCSGHPHHILEEHHRSRTNHVINAVVLTLHPGENCVRTSLATCRHGHRNVYKVLRPNRTAEAKVQCFLLECSSAGFAQSAIDMDLYCSSKLQAVLPLRRARNTSEWKYRHTLRRPLKKHWTPSIDVCTASPHYILCKHWSVITSGRCYDGARINPEANLRA